MKSSGEMNGIIFATRSVLPLPLLLQQRWRERKFVEFKRLKVSFPLRATELPGRIGYREEEFWEKL
jgi:hypothetical protein